MAAIHELDRLLLREGGVGDQDLVDLVEVALYLLERPEVLEAVARHRRQRHESDRLHLRLLASLEGVRHRGDLRAAADEHGSARVPGRAEDRSAHALEPPPEERDVDEGEEQAPVEDVVGGEVVALHDRVGQHQERDLEQG